MTAAAAASAERRAIDVLGEADEQRFSNLRSRRPQPARRTDQRRRELFVRGLVLQRDADDVLSLRRQDFVDALQDRLLGVLEREEVFLRVDRLNCLDLVLRKKLLRSLAARSAVAVVHPVDFFHRVPLESKRL